MRRTLDDKGEWDIAERVNPTAEELIHIDLSLSDDEIERIIESGKAKDIDFACRNNHRYHEGIPKAVPYMYRNGESDAEVAIKIGVSKMVFIAWMQKHPEFKAAVICGRGLAEAWWQRLGRAGAVGDVRVQPAIWYANMKNRFNWIDKVQHSIDEEKREIVDLSEQVKKALEHDSKQIESTSNVIEHKTDDDAR